MKHRKLYGWCAVLLLSGCRADPEIVTQEAGQHPYFPVKQGNYWEYAMSITDRSGNVRRPSSTYRLVALPDTLIGDQWYHVLEERPFTGFLLPGRYYRANNGKWLTSTGLESFSNNVIPKPFREYAHRLGVDTIFILSAFMELTSTPVQVPAGAFTDVLQRKDVIHLVQAVPDLPDTLFQYTHYAKGIGLLSTGSYSLPSGEYKSLQLVGFKVQ